MKENFEFGGCSTDSKTTDFKTEFETLYDDCSSFHQSREVFEHNEEGLSFKYRLCVRVTDLEEFDPSCAGKTLVELQLVPLLESLGKKTRESVLKCCGVDDGECSAMDIADYGAEVTLASEECKTEEVDRKLESVANIYKTVNSLRGFYLDRYVNRIGSTGWDLLHDYINGVDFVSATLGRYRA